MHNLQFFLLSLVHELLTLLLFLEPINFFLLHKVVFLQLEHLVCLILPQLAVLVRLLFPLSLRRYLGGAHLLDLGLERFDFAALSVHLPLGN